MKKKKNKKEKLSELSDAEFREEIRQEWGFDPLPVGTELSLEVVRQIAAKQREPREASAEQHFPEGAWPTNEIVDRVFGNIATDNNRNALRQEMHHFRVAYLEYASNKGPLHKVRKRKMDSIAREAALNRGLR